MKIFHKIRNFVPIISDGAIGSPEFADGRIIPVLIVDCSNHFPLEDFILAQKDTPPGDVELTWGWKPFNKTEVFLTFNFLQPIETSASIAFDVSKYGGLIDWIINSRGVYLQPLSSGVTVSDGLGNPKILVEVPPSATFPTWQKIYRENVERSYRRSGLSKLEAKESAREHINRRRELHFKRTRPV